MPLYRNSSGTSANNNRQGVANIAVGDTALSSANLSGPNNTATGFDALKNNQGGQGNVANGALSLKSNASGLQNTAAGYQSLVNCLGNNNVGIGANAGFSIVSGSENTMIGAGTEVDLGGRTRCVAIGYGATTPAVNGSLSIGGATAANQMSGLTTNTAPSGATGTFLRIWLNGVEYRIPIQRAS